MTKSLSSPLVPLILASLTALVWTAYLASHVGTYHVDLEVYHEGGRALVRAENLYTQTYELSNGQALPFTYPPFAAVLFALVAWIPLPILSALLSLASFAALWMCVYTITRRTSSRPSLWAGWGLLACMATEPVWETINYGQVNLLLTAAVVIDCLALARRSPWRGVLTGIAISIKLTPAVFLAVFFVRREWRALATALMSCAACAVIGWGASPASSAMYWTDTLWNSSRIGGLSYSSNQSLRGVLSRVAPEHASALWICGCVIIVAALWWIMEHTADDVALVLLASTAALLCSPVSWSHHFTWLSLAGVYLILHRRWVLATLTWVALLARGHWLVPHSGDRELTWSWWQHLPGNDYFLVTVILVCTSAWLSRRSETSGPHNHSATPRNEPTGKLAAYRASEPGSAPSG